MDNLQQSPVIENSPTDAGSDSDRDRAARELVHAYLRAFSQRDLATCLTFFNEDAHIAFMRQFAGLPAIEKWHRQRFENNVQIVSVSAIEVMGDTVTVEATVTSKLLKLGFKLFGRAILRLDGGKIQEVSFGRPEFRRQAPPEADAALHERSRSTVEA